MKTIIISDIHIGDARGLTNLNSLYSLLEKHTDHHLILNGDVFDFAQKLEFGDSHRKFISLIRKFKKITYICGNHDWFVDGIRDSLAPFVEFRKELIINYNCLKIHILHGHQSDFTVSYLFPLVNLFIKFNDFLVRKFKFDLQLFFTNSLIGKFFRKRMEEKVAEKINADVIIAGHTHQPGMTKYDNKTYYNLGDWISESNRYYLIIDENGKCSLNKCEF